MKTIAISAVIALITALGVGFMTTPETPISLGSVASPDVYSHMNVHGALSQGGGVTTVTPTSSSVTLTYAQMIENNVITFTASTTQPALSVTLPASSTFPLPLEAGAYRDWVIKNPFTGAATTTTIVAGAGIDLQEPDGQNVVIGVTNFVWLTCFREITTNIVCLVDESIPAD